MDAADQLAEAGDQLKSPPRSQPAKVLWLLIVSWILAGGSMARADVRFDMFVGYDGVVPQGSWLPISFEVENDGETFVATIEVTPSRFDSGHEHFMKVELPKRTTKRFTIPVFAGAGWNPSWNARVLDEKRRVRAVAENPIIKRLNTGMLPVAASLARYLPALPQLKARQDNMRPAFARMQTSLMPDNPLALDGLDVLYLSSERALELKPGQVSALLSWMHGGGHLVVSVEQPGHLTGSGSWLNPVLPGQVSGMTSIPTHTALQEWLVSAGRFDGKNYEFVQGPRRTNRPSRPGVSPNPGFNPNADPNPNPNSNPYAALEADAAFEGAPLEIVQVTNRDGTALVGGDDRPLVLIARRGLGQISMLTFAPEREPFRAWKNAPYFWAKMVDLSPDLFTVEWPNRSSGQPVDAVFGAMIDSRQIRKLPVGWLLLLLLAYLVVIGPLDQYWLKKMNRQMLTWLTFPAYVVFFSLLIYFIGYKLRAGDSEWTEMHVVDVIQRPGGAEIRGRSYGSIYSPVNARYNFANDVALASFRAEFAGNYGNSESSRGRIEQLPQGFAADVAVPVWTSRLFVSDWLQSAAPLVGLEVGQREVRVANRLDRPLVAARLVIGTTIYELGDVPQGGTKSFQRQNLASSSLKSFVGNHAGSLSSIVGYRQQVFAHQGGGRIDDWTNTVLAVSFAHRPETGESGRIHTPRGFDLNAIAGEDRAVLVAWAPGHSPVSPLNRFPAARTRRDTVFRVVAKIDR